MIIEDNYIRHIHSIERVIDGDTIIALVELGYNIIGKVTFRFADINTAELRSEKGSVRYKLAHKAKDYVDDKLNNSEVRVHSEKFRDGGFGRYLGVMYYLNDDNEWINLNQELLNIGLAQEYYEGASKDFDEWK